VSKAELSDPADSETLKKASYAEYVFTSGWMFMPSTVPRRTPAPRTSPNTSRASL
jgi:hypothetical protein